VGRPEPHLGWIGTQSESHEPETAPASGRLSSAPVRPLKITSPAFDVNGKIPPRFTADGANVSPALAWTNVPRGTKSLVLILEDSDAASPEPFAHWVVYRIPPAISGIPEGVPPGDTLDDPPSAVHGVNTLDVRGYSGPSPPRGHGPHHYHFRLYALDTMIEAEPGLTRAELMDLVRGHVISAAEVVGTYQR
jgi:Raf kinase inhibitor-like YbhB/YbcL family protein